MAWTVSPIMYEEESESRRGIVVDAWSNDFPETPPWYFFRELPRPSPELLFHNMIMQRDPYTMGLTVTVIFRDGNGNQKNYTINLNELEANRIGMAQFFHRIARELEHDYECEEVRPYEARCPYCHYVVAKIKRNADYDVSLQEFLHTQVEWFPDLKDRGYYKPDQCPKCSHQERDFFKNLILRTLYKK